MYVTIYLLEYLRTEIQLTQSPSSVQRPHTTPCPTRQYDVSSIKRIENEVPLPNNNLLSPSSAEKTTTSSSLCSACCNRHIISIWLWLPSSECICTAITVQQKSIAYHAIITTARHDVTTLLSHRSQCCCHALTIISNIVIESLGQCRCIILHGFPRSTIRKDNTCW